MASSGEGGGAGDDSDAEKSKKSKAELREEEKNARIDEYLESKGRKAEPNPLEGVEGAGRQGDRFVDGVKTEYKTLDPGASPNTVKNVVNNSIRKGGQARNIIIDARGSGLGQEEAAHGISKAMVFRGDELIR
ncbi:hypothetical protein CYFUS_005493 [Cystobacter fuscus]|uniref:tRNA nuclease CdiA C-terminal domain-containing protein n=2 Tax=Cystobacter fuscus TaxID=43 RepID=A0A250J811_9BACT|nr:hypothetical protein CYFUS_005493 [Cystobacter fuscus]